MQIAAHINTYVTCVDLEFTEHNHIDKKMSFRESILIAGNYSSMEQVI